MMQLDSIPHTRSQPPVLKISIHHNRPSGFYTLLLPSLKQRLLMDVIHPEGMVVFKKIIKPQTISAGLDLRKLKDGHYTLRFIYIEQVVWGTLYKCTTNLIDDPSLKK